MFGKEQSHGWRRRIEKTGKRLPAAAAENGRAHSPGRLGRSAVDAVSLQRLRHVELSAAAAIVARGRKLREVQVLRPAAVDDVRRDRPLLARRDRPRPYEAAQGYPRPGLLRLGIRPPAQREIRLHQHLLRSAAATRSLQHRLDAPGGPTASISSRVPMCWSMSSRRSSGRSRTCVAC